jgi:hypothetical protein
VVTTLARSRGPAAALLTLAAGLTGCSPAAAPSPATVAGPAPVLASATLTDDVDPAAGTWSTTWEACFRPPPGEEDPERWEVRAVTVEGVSPRVDELPGSCVELQLAQGPGTAPADDPGRTAALADAASLAHQARGVHADGSVTPWSEPVVAGTVG